MYDNIDDSDIIIAYLPYGNDCNVEVGYSKGKNKYVVLVIDSSNHWQDDWMAKRAAKAVVVLKKELVDVVKNDLILGNLPICHVKNDKDFSDFLIDIKK